MKLNKFLFVLPTDQIGGAERVAMTMVRYLSDTYTDSVVTVFFMSRGDSGSWNDLKNVTNIKLIYNDCRSEKLAVPYLVYYLKLHGNKIDFVYSTHTHVNSLLCCLRALKIFSCKYLVIRESTIISLRFSGIKKIIFNILYMFYGSQDLLICQTDLMCDEFKKARSIKAGRHINVIKNPLDLRNIQSLISNGEFSRLPNDDFSIVMIGRLVAIKNHSLAIKVVSKLKLCGIDNVKLTIVGDGPLRVELETLVSSLGLTDAVEFLGVVGNPYQYMTAADLGLMSSFSEGFPNVLIEMMAAGIKNIVTTPCAGNLDDLPKVTVTSDHSIDSMSAAITNVIYTKSDFSLVYIEYSKCRDIKLFWKSIIDGLSHTSKSGLLGNR